MRDGVDAPALALARMLAASRRARASLQVGYSRMRAGPVPPQIATADPAVAPASSDLVDLTGP